MAKTKKKSGPDRTSLQYEKMLPMWLKMDALLGGTEEMRARGTTYMPMHPGEDTSRYQERLGSAVLWNQTELTLGGWEGRPFSDPLKLKEDVPEQIVDLKENIDMQGNNMNVFARKWFRVGVSKAFCHVLVEQPTIQPREDGRPLSKGETDKQNIRPYWVLVEPNDVISARSEIINGVDVWTNVRIKESVLVPSPDDEFAEVIEKRIRVYDRVEQAGGAVVSLRTYKEQVDEKGSGTTWVLATTVQLQFDEIPMVTFYAQKEGFLLGKSPLQDLADLNIKHWQEQSDQDTILRIARFPILAGSGVDSLDGGDPLNADAQGSQQPSNRAKFGHVMGPHTVLLAEDKGAKFYYVEHTGAAIGAGQSALDKLEEKMAGYGSEFLKKNPDRQTATAKALDSAESVSPLVAVTLLFVDAFEQVLAMTAKWLNIKEGVKPGGGVELVTDFGPEEASAVDLTTLGSAWQGGAISSKQYRREIKRRGVLSDDFDEDENAKELQSQALDLSGTSLPGSSVDLDEKAPDEKEENSKTKKKEDEDENNKKPKS